MSDGWNEEERTALLSLGSRVFAAMRRYFHGLARLEVECFAAPPRADLEGLIPLGISLKQDDDDALLCAGEWWLRCRPDGTTGSWKAVSAGRSCEDCEGSGACSNCTETPDPDCKCAGMGLCASCQGLGKLIWF